MGGGGGGGKVYWALIHVIIKLFTVWYVGNPVGSIPATACVLNDAEYADREV